MRTFGNCTNGYRMGRESIRLQSTACEQKRWSFIIEDLDYNFLIALFQGPVVVFDVSEKHRWTRAQWQGMAWVKFCAEHTLDMDTRAWIGRGGRSMDCTKYFLTQWGELTNHARKKLKYCSKFWTGGPIQIILDNGSEERRAL